MKLLLAKVEIGMLFIGVTMTGSGTFSHLNGRSSGFFNSECTDGAAHELLIKFLNEDFSVLDSSYSLKDDNKKSLKKEECTFNYDFPYTISQDRCRISNRGCDKRSL